MQTISMLLVVLSFFFISAPLVLAAPIINLPAMPYAPLAIDAAIEREQIYLGELTGEPHMYEVTVGETKTFTATILQQVTNDGSLPLSLILVRSNEGNRGVTEIGRVVGRDISWQTEYDSLFGMSFAKSEAITYELTPGVYRFEISTAENLGKYMLVLGDTPVSTGYFATLATVKAVQDFFGASALRALYSTAVLYPLGSLVLLILIVLTWRWHRSRMYA
jgi:hypothetical protein